MTTNRALLALLALGLLAAPVRAADSAAVADGKSASPSVTDGKSASPSVTDGNVVSLDVQVFGEDGKEVHVSKAGEPLVYTHGKKEIFPKLEAGVAGLKVGDEKDVTLEPADAFGVVDPQRVIEVPKEKIPADGLKVGTVLGANGPDGKPHPVRVKEIKDKTVLIDANHPLAGQKLRFHVKVAKIEKAAIDAKGAAPKAPEKK